jgi:hypothetical protein
MLNCYKIFFFSSADRRVTIFDGYKMFSQVIRSAIRSIKSLSSRISILPSVAYQDDRLLQDVASQVQFKSIRLVLSL